MKKILVVDDEPQFGQMVKINLEEAGACDVDIALNALQAYDMVKESQYDLIFLDILMPKVEGHVALVELKKLTDTPVVLLSAYLPAHHREDMIERGASAYLEKPVELEDLIKTIEKFAK